MRTLTAEIGLRFVGACVLMLCVSGELNAQFGGFGGMSGAGNAGAMGANGQPTGSSVRPWLAVNGSYNENVSSLGDFSRYPTSFGYGGSGSLGLSGGKAWKRDSLAGAATASYQRFGGGGISSGVSFASSLAYSHMFSQRVGFFAAQSYSTTFGGYGYGAGMGSFGTFGLSGLGVFRDFGFGGSFGIPDSANNGVVDSDIIGTRVNFLSTTAGFSFQPSLRWSFGVGGTVNMARRESNRLNDVTSYGGGGSASYRVSERLTVGLSGQGSTFSYGGFYTDNKSYSGGLGLSYQISPRTMFSGFAGVSAYQASNFGAIPIDPIVASLIGQPNILALNKVSVASGAGGAIITHSRGPFSFSASYDRGITPGNGLLYASKRDAVNGSISYRPVTRFGMSAFWNYGRLSSIAQSGAKNTSTSVAGSFDVRLVGSLFFTCGGGYRYNKLSNTNNLTQRFATVGLSWSPDGAMFRF